MDSRVKLMAQISAKIAKGEGHDSDLDNRNATVVLHKNHSADKAGTQLAHWALWNREMVLEVAIAALTDCNYHTEAIEELLKELREVK